MTQELHIYACWGKEQKFPQFDKTKFKLITTRDEDYFIGLQLIDNSFYSDTWSPTASNVISNLSKIEDFHITQDYLAYSRKIVFGNNLDYDIPKDKFKQKLVDSFREIEFLESVVYPAIDASEHIDVTTFTSDIIKSVMEIKKRIQTYCEKHRDRISDEDIANLKMIEYSYQ